MEFTLQTPGKPSPVTQAPAKEEPAKPETSAAAAEPAKPTPSPSESAKSAGSGSPAEPAKPEKPGRAAAAASKKQRQADQAAQAADAKKASADKVAADVEKYRAAVESGDVDKILAAFGLDDEKVVDLYLAKHGTKDENGETKDPNADELKQIKAELEKFKADLAAEKTKTEEKRQADAAQAQVQGMIGQIRDLAAKPENAERFELCNAGAEVIGALTGGEYQSAAAAAFDVMVEIWKGGEGERISYEKALELTEAHLLKRHEALAGGLGKLKKLGGKVPEKKPDEGKAPVAKADEPAAEGLDAMRAKFKASRPRVTNGLSVIHPVASTGPKGRSAADQRFRDRVLALQKGAAN